MFSRRFCAIVALCLTGAGAFAQDLPEHLQTGGSHYCLDRFSMPSKAACDKLVEKAALAKGCSPGTLYCLGIMLRVNPQSRAGRTDLVIELAAFRNREIERVKRAARRESETSVDTKTFTIEGQAVALPRQFMVAWNKNYSGSGKVSIWTNLHPNEACPDEALIFLEFSGTGDATAFNSWSTERDLRGLNIALGNYLQTRDTTKGKGVPACSGAQNYEIVVQAFDESNYIGGIIVPASETGPRGDGRTFIDTNLGPILAAYGEPRSRY